MYSTSTSEAACIYLLRTCPVLFCMFLTDRFFHSSSRSVRRWSRLDLSSILVITKLVGYMHYVEQDPFHLILPNLTYLIQIEDFSFLLNEPAICPYIYLNYRRQKMKTKKSNNKCICTTGPRVQLYLHMYCIIHNITRTPRPDQILKMEELQLQLLRGFSYPGLAWSNLVGRRRPECRPGYN